MGFSGILTREEYEELFENGKTFRRKIPVKAIQMNRRFSIETRDGIIVAGHPGDYIVQNTRGDSRPWVVRKDIFEDSFEALSQEDTDKEHRRPKYKHKDHGEIH